MEHLLAENQMPCFNRLNKKANVLHLQAIQPTQIKPMQNFNNGKLKQLQH